jgi:hypothetical protein
MATQSMACPTALAKAGWFSGGLPQQFASAGLDKNAGSIAAKVLVQSKNLYKQKCSPDQCLDDANTTQHLPLPGGLLRVVRRYIVAQSL